MGQNKQLVLVNDVEVLKSWLKACRRSVESRPSRDLRPENVLSSASQ